MAIKDQASLGCLAASAGPFTAIDPGIAYHGRAEFSGSGNLVHVAYVPGSQIMLSQRTGIGVIEKPVVYPQLTRNARTVADLAFSAGVLLGQFTVRLYVEPRTWKGTTDGDVFLRRVRRHAEQTGDWNLITECLRGVPKRLWEHVLDAYGLGQWCLGVQL